MTDLAKQLWEGLTPECDEAWKDGDDYLLLLTARSLERRLNVAVGALDILMAEVLFVLADGQTHLEDFNNNEAIKHTRNALQLLRGPQT